MTINYNIYIEGEREKEKLREKERGRERERKREGMREIQLHKMTLILKFCELSSLSYFILLLSI